MKDVRVNRAILKTLTAVLLVMINQMIENSNEPLENLFIIDNYRQYFHYR